MSQFAQAVVKELKAAGVRVSREVSGIAHVEHLIADHGKELVKKALGNAITNMVTHVDTTGRRLPTAEEQRQWDADRTWVKDRFGI